MYEGEHLNRTHLERVSGQSDNLLCFFVRFNKAVLVITDPGDRAV
jgi:hypothetical protein